MREDIQTNELVYDDIVEPEDKIGVYGARVHNLRNIVVEIPRDKLTVITGLSGAANRRWPSIPFMPKGSAGTSKPFLLMHARFWATLNGPMLIKLPVLAL
jgi:hypothetical protein